MATCTAVNWEVPLWLVTFFIKPMQHVYVRFSPRHACHNYILISFNEMSSVIKRHVGVSNLINGRISGSILEVDTQFADGPRCHLHKFYSNICGVILVGVRRRVEGRGEGMSMV